VAGFIPDALAWLPAGGEPAFLHKGTGGASDLAGAYNLEIAADGAAVYTAPRAEPELVLAGLAIGEDGSLSPLSVEALTPDAVGAGAMLNVTLSPDGEHVYAVDADYGGLHTYARSQQGALERAVRRQIPDCAGRPPMAVDVVTSHDGSQVYVADFQWEDPSCVHVFGVDQEGIAQEVSQTVATEALGGVEALAPTPDGTEVLAACHQASAVTRLQRDRATGHLSLLEVVRRDDLAGAEFVVLSPDGRSVYASSPVSDTVVVFGRDTAEGNLTWLQTLTAGPNLPLVDAAGLAVTEDGQHVLVAARISNTVSLFARGSDGRLSLEHQVQQGDPGVDGLTWVNGVDVHKNRVVTAAVADGAVSSFLVVDANQD
jgi:6-phosphogluconolactonase (cycloisomerase 2 family)